MTGLDLRPLRQRLSETLAEQGAFREPWLRRIFDKVPRHLFVPETIYTWSEEKWRPLHKSDDPWRWARLIYDPGGAGVVTQVDDGDTDDEGCGLVPTSSISSVGAVLDMLLSLDPEPDHSVLEIGTGTGYNAALLCERVGELNVVTMEVDEGVAVEARRRLHDAGYHPEVVIGDGLRGFGIREPYSRIISTASVRKVPLAWLDQTVVHGELVVPWLPNDRGLGLMWLRRKDQDTARGWFHGTETFMAVRGHRSERPDLAGLWHKTRTSSREVDRTINMDDVDASGCFVLAAVLPGVSCYRQDDGWFLVSMDRASWCRVTDGGAITAYGDGDLPGRLSSALEWWRGQGRPKYHEFGVIVTRSGSDTDQVMWLGEDTESPIPQF